MENEEKSTSSSFIIHVNKKKNIITKVINQTLVWYKTHVENLEEKKLPGWYKINDGPCMISFWC